MRVEFSNFLGSPGARLVALAILWGHLIYQTHYQWGDESYYNFGWAVPALVLVLLGNRLGSEALAAELGGSRGKGRGMIAGLILLSLIPVSILSEVNVVWRVPLLVHAGMLLALTWIWFEAILGKVNRQFFFFPLAFALTMFPWPYAIEAAIISRFSEQVTVFTTRVLNLMGIGAAATGNIIQLGDLTVGVDDACSGIRSFQSLLMIALFLGDFFFLSPWRRVGLVGAGIVCVFIFNSLRSIVLALCFFLVGEDFYDQWHDPVGLITFSGSLVCVFVITVILTRSRRQFQEGVWKANLALIFPPRGGGFAPAWAWAGAAAGVLLAVEGWFWVRGEGEGSLMHFAVVPVEGKFSRIESLEVPDWIEASLGFDYSYRFRAMGPERLQVELYYYGYTGANRMRSVSSYGHSPLVCMEAVGATWQQTLEPVTVEVGGQTHLFNHYLFTTSEASGSHLIHVLWTISERNNRGMDAGSLQQWNWSTQLRQAFLGRRDYARTVTLISVAGSEDSALIWEAASEILRTWFKSSPETPAPT